MVREVKVCVESGIFECDREKSLMAMVLGRDAEAWQRSVAA